MAVNYMQTNAIKIIVFHIKTTTTTTKMIYREVARKQNLVDRQVDKLNEE